MATSPQLPRIMLSGSKAAATASMSKTQAVLTSSSSAQQSSSSTRHHARTRSSSVNLHRCEKSGGVGAPADAISDRATTAFIYRVLCRQSSLNGSNQSKPLEELLPPLSSSNEVDLQLYALIAIIIKEFVYSWYSKITPDHAFADELVQIIAHCTRALEQRLRRVDIDALILDELPALLDAHIYGRNHNPAPCDLWKHISGQLC
ncbi:hypothetical protein KEM55_008014 [Ascosphaera atra]|nr:hypothetical protein KEM55_008014 [Ascosphaera atra]